MLNAMTVDLEDWGQGVLDPRLPVTEHVLRNAERVLRLLDRHGVRATFFALGKVCERFPELLPTIASAGHEIASHGYGHELIYRLSPEAFENDVRKSIEIIESQTGRRPVGYRAPAFSITRRSLWAGPILVRLGVRYSSSIFPVAKQRYGIPDWPDSPGRWPGCPLLEFPLTTFQLAGRRIPGCGGGYMRLFPALMHAYAIARRNRLGCPAVVYVHPYEFAPGEVAAFRREGYRFSRKRSVMQSLWRSRVVPRMEYLLDRFEFGAMRETLQQIPVPAVVGQTATEAEHMKQVARLAVGYCEEDRSGFSNEQLLGEEAVSCQPAFL